MWFEPGDVEVYDVEEAATVEGWKMWFQATAMPKNLYMYHTHRLHGTAIYAYIGVVWGVN